MLPGAESVGLTSLLLCSCGLQARAPLDTVEKVDAVLRYITPAIKDEGEVRVIGDEDRFEFEQEQHLVARMFHLIANEDTDVHFALYSTARKFFGQGGTQRIEYTLPALVFGSLQLALRIHARESGGDDSMAVKTKKIFGFIHETISVLTPHFPDIALRLFMHAAQISDRCAYDAISYEYVVQAFTAYEGGDRRQQGAIRSHHRHGGVPADLRSAQRRELGHARHQVDTSSSTAHPAAAHSSAAPPPAAADLSSVDVSYASACFSAGPRSTVRSC